MGWFGGESSDTSGAGGTEKSSDSLDLSGYGSDSSGFGSKRRAPSSSEYDFSSPSSSSMGGVGGGDVERVIQHEQQKLQLMTAIHKINDVCWDLCVEGVGSSLGSKGETCIRNCAERFVDTTLLVTNRFAQLAQKMQGGHMK